MKLPTTVVVAGGKGGVGKTTVAVNLAGAHGPPEFGARPGRVTEGGVLIATTLHPAFFLQATGDDEQDGYRMVRGYLDEEVWWVDTFGGHRHYYRPLGAYIEWAASLGLGVVELYEPPAASYRGWHSRIPTRLGFAARPVQRQST